MPGRWRYVHCQGGQKLPLETHGAVGDRLRGARGHPGLPYQCLQSHVDKEASLWQDHKEDARQNTCVLEDTKN